MWETFQCHRNALPARVPYYVPDTASGHMGSTNVVLTSRQGLLAPQTPRNCAGKGKRAPGHFCAEKCTGLSKGYMTAPELTNTFGACNQTKNRCGATEKGLLVRATESGHRPWGWHQASTLLLCGITVHALHGVGGTRAQQPGRRRAQGEPARWASGLGAASLWAAS